MNIDGRIEALTHSLELLSQIHRDNEKVYAGLFQRLGRMVEDHGERIARLKDNAS